jgi:hypothetical protein
MLGTRTSYMEIDFAELRGERHGAGFLHKSNNRRSCETFANQTSFRRGPRVCVHVDHHQKDTIPGYTEELGYQVGQLRAE